MDYQIGETAVRLFASLTPPQRRDIISLFEDLDQHPAAAQQITRETLDLFRNYPTPHPDADSSDTSDTSEAPHSKPVRFCALTMKNLTGIPQPLAKAALLHIARLAWLMNQDHSSVAAQLGPGLLTLLHELHNCGTALPQHLRNLYSALSPLLANQCEKLLQLPDHPPSGGS